MARKKANPIDVAVGHRIRLFRMKSGLSQTELGAKTGVTFQQVQKYEKGTNRVGASRLIQIADALKVPVSAFFGDDASGRGPSVSDEITELLVQPQALKLLQAFSKVKSGRIQARIINLIETIAAESPNRS